MSHKLEIFTIWVFLTGVPCLWQSANCFLRMSGDEKTIPGTGTSGINELKLNVFLLQLIAFQIERWAPLNWCFMDGMSQCHRVLWKIYRNIQQLFTWFSKVPFPPKPTVRSLFCLFIYRLILRHALQRSTHPVTHEARSVHQPSMAAFLVLDNSPVFAVQDR